ncbi:Bifunctional heparan sulfate N-deacetylase/N-sulfotransferase 3 [Hondaea fermentalgiana]|uniref:Bifunctional heparan sulfate N-deacetylase/N-sulfotransferase 3 n=1 Tax=Hondaea fermentalgiana TaxID=2315210 RepID=A0A2R5GC38_9STRA|nr:Bifunctional heparan sulfate N-deacetylase/N-sulfotransferase 3 [Hondaea fermentalgiana]|eukprot:GBG28550.1 Bifunctional heparan sulfate N-deacetylase/N-sulfotransferase 3 [Hondaea fermentalgiana]
MVGEETTMPTQEAPTARRKGAALAAATLLAATFMLGAGMTFNNSARINALDLEEADSVARPINESPLVVTPLEPDQEAPTQESDPLRTQDVLPNFYNDTFFTYECSRLPKQGSLPNFLVIGVHKGGSTALYGYLMQHGHVRPATCKEIHFFTNEETYKRGIGYYKKHFHDTKATPWVLTGEGSPDYVRSPVAPVRISAALPRAKFVVSMRNPVERFVSQYVGFLERNLYLDSCASYWTMSRDEIETCERDYKPDLHQSLPSEPDGMTAWSALRAFADPALLAQALGEADLGPVPPRPKSTKLTRHHQTCATNEPQCVRRYCLGHFHDNAIARSIYVDQLVRWLRFVPPSRIMLIQAEVMYKDTPATLQRIASFLELRPFSAFELSHFSEAFRGSSHHTDPAAASCDRETFAPYFVLENNLLDALVAAQFPAARLHWVSWAA